MGTKFCFVAVEFVNDPNVAGLTYWYLCDFAGATEGCEVTAPLGRHNNCQTGIIRRVTFETQENSPYPVQYIKRIKSLNHPIQE